MPRVGYGKPAYIKKNHGVLIKNTVKNYLLHGENKYALELDIEVLMSANDRVEAALFGRNLCLYNKGKKAYRKMKHPYNPFYAICWSFYDLCIHSLDYCSSKLLEKFYKELGLGNMPIAIWLALVRCNEESKHQYYNYHHNDEDDDIIMLCD